MRCLMCGKPMSKETFADLFREEDVLCADCRDGWKRIRRNFRFQGKKAFVLYEYNAAFSSCLLQFKECGDEALKTAFLYPDRGMLRRMYHGRTLLLMPSSEEKERERGFSHLKELFEGVGLPMMEPFLKTGEQSQKSLGRKERRNMSRGILLKPGIVLPHRCVLADDVITTGSTMRGALSVLPEGLDLRIFACALTPSRTSEDFLNA